MTIEGKKTKAVLLACAIAAVPATAIAGTTSYSGQLKGVESSAVDFKVSKKNGKSKVKGVSVRNAPAECSETDAFLSTSISGSAKVKDKKFTLKAQDSFSTVVFEGKLTNRGRSAVGTYSFKGFVSVDGTTQGCSTGKLDWSASR